ncbi:hypothetical protein HK100_001999 [Physocladia obscura]|uniref:Uncharacterized protein n=1 Tax=Physocladia obscura TaxID=109957 RepID=A0AAD5SX52_9FUNG|nr:hypothetical protein HK100_001999 [Physocladia obscura]
MAATRASAQSKVRALAPATVIPVRKVTFKQSLLSLSSSISSTSTSPTTYTAAHQPRLTDGMDFGDIDASDAVASSLEFIVPKKDDPTTPALTSTPYGMENVASQVMPELMALGFIFVTQFTGLGFAGLCRRFLVRPRAIIWPSTFATLALFASFHGIGENITESVILTKKDVENVSISRGASSLFPIPEDTEHGTMEVKGPQTFIVCTSGVIPTNESRAEGGDARASRSMDPSVSTMIDDTADNLSVSIESDEDRQRKKGAFDEMAEGRSTRQRAFWFSFLGMYLYTFIPEFFFPMLQSVSICTQQGLDSLKSGSLGNFNTVSSSTNGIGFMTFTFDWYYITSMYMTTPFWAIMCYAAGNMIFSWIITVLLYVTNTWGLNSYLTEGSRNPALNSVHLFSGNPNSTVFQLGEEVDPGYFYDKKNNYNLNLTAYNEVAPIHVTPFFAMQYGSSFLTIAAVLSHVGLWYGSIIKRQAKNAFKQISDSVEAGDIHNKLMLSYWDPPDWMFLLFVTFMAGLTLVVTQFTAFVMPWWGVLMNLAVTGILIIPIGIITGISGISISISVLAEFLMGSLIPGQTVAVMAFKSLALNNLNQGLLLVSGLKIGHYLHIPPMAIIIAQFIGTFLSCIVATAVSWLIIFGMGNLLNANHGDWRFISYQTFYSDGAIWGAIGPSRFFVPIIFTLSGVGGFQNAIVTQLLIGFVAQVLVFRYWKSWYQTYNFVMASAFDIGK